MKRIEYDSFNNRYILRGNVFFVGLSAVALFMMISGIRMICDILPFEEGYTGGDIFGLGFMCVWTLVVTCGFLVGLTNATKKMIINSEGVTTKNLFSKKTYLWAEIEDYGVSYSGNTRGEGNTYDLYFSKQPQKTKNECRKRLKGKMLKTYIFETDYTIVAEDIMPFCRQYTAVEPFVGEDKFHFIG